MKISKEDKGTKLLLAAAFAAGVGFSTLDYSKYDWVQALAYFLMVFPFIAYFWILDDD